MRFKNTISLFIDNFGNIYKVLLYRVIIALVICGLSAGLLLPSLLTIINSVEFSAITDLIQKLITAILQGDVQFWAGFGDLFQTALKNFLTFVSDSSLMVLFTVISVILIYVISTILFGMGDFVLGTVINDKMTSYAKTSFSRNYISSLGKSFLYSLIILLINIIYNGIVLAICYLLMLFASGVITGLILLCLVVTIIAVASAVKATFLNSFIPLIVTDEVKPFKAFMQSLKMGKDNFGAMFTSYLVSIYAVVAITVIMAISTFLSGLLICIPAIIIFFLCMQFVNYFDITEKKYFIAQNKIISNKNKNNTDFYDNFEE